MTKPRRILLILMLWIFFSSMAVAFKTGPDTVVGNGMALLAIVDQIAIIAIFWPATRIEDEN